MVTGKEFSLAIPVLTSIYRGPREISLSLTPCKFQRCIPAHYIYVWLGKFFGTHNSLEHWVDGPTMTILSGEKSAKFFTKVRARELIAHGHKIQWNSTILPISNAAIYVDDGKLSISKNSYFISLRSGYLSLRQDDYQLVEPYSPHRFCRQFGFCQETPGDLSSMIDGGNLEELFQFHNTLTKIGTNSSCFMPSCSINLSSRVTIRYKDWWHKASGDPIRKIIAALNSECPRKEQPHKKIDHDSEKTITEEVPPNSHVRKHLREELSSREVEDDDHHWNRPKKRNSAHNGTPPHEMCNIMDTVNSPKCSNYSSAEKNESSKSNNLGHQGTGNTLVDIEAISSQSKPNEARPEIILGEASIFQADDAYASGQRLAATWTSKKFKKKTSHHSI